MDKDLVLEIRDSINRHGVFFKKRVKKELEDIEGITIEGEEYPISYQKTSAIDIVFSYTHLLETYIVPVECKKGYVENKMWVFFEDVHRTKFYYRFEGKNCRSIAFDSGGKFSAPICSEGVEIDKAKGAKMANPDPISKACEQISNNFLGLVRTEILEKNKLKEPTSDIVLMFPMIVTNAPLYIANYKIEDVDLEKGALLKDLALTEVACLIMSHPFAPQDNMRTIGVNTNCYTNIMDRGTNYREGILVVNSKHLVNLPRWLQN